MMAYLEELLPEFRKGAKIRRTGVPQPANAKGYIFYKEGKIYNEFGRECDPDLGFWLSKNDWEFYQEPEPDWQYIIDHRCLCWFWDEEDLKCLGLLIRFPEKKDQFQYKTNIHKGVKYFKYCRPVRRDEVTFYDEKE